MINTYLKIIFQISCIVIAITMLSACPNQTPDKTLVEHKPILSHLKNEIAISSLEDEVASRLMDSIEEISNQTIDKVKLASVLTSIRETTEKHLETYVSDQGEVEESKLIEVYSLISILTFTETIADATKIELTGAKTHKGHKCQTNRGPCIPNKRFNCRHVKQWCIQVKK